MDVSRKKIYNWDFLECHDLIYPLFIKEEGDSKEAIESLPGVFRFSLDSLVDEVKRLESLGIRKLLLFGIPAYKDARGAAAYTHDIVSSAIQVIRSAYPTVEIFTDICLCAYTDHGHCGLLQDDGMNIDCHRTTEVLAQIALCHAASGADWVAPSAMMPGQVAVIRAALDTQGYEQVSIMSYSAKFASHFYGPFRSVVDSTPAVGDRSGYQLDYAESSEAYECIKTDIKQGADMVMVKPALCYLDIIHEITKTIDRPLAVYNVSGEYAMIKHGANKHWWAEEAMVHEIMSGLKRAGAAPIITYHAATIAAWKKGFKNAST